MLLRSYLPFKNAERLEPDGRLGFKRQCINPHGKCGVIFNSYYVGLMIELLRFKLMCSKTRYLPFFFNANLFNRWSTDMLLIR